MENKSNSLNRIKRHQREKVLRFSIRKYSFGAASVAVAALMFLGARVVSADTVSGSNSQSTAGVVQPNDKGNSPVGIKEPTENKSEVVNSSLENKETALVENSSNTVDKSQLRTVVEELNSLLSTKLNLDDSVLSSVKERVQRAQALLDKADAVQKDINELKELLSTDLATLSNAVKESSEVRESNTGTEAEKPASQPSSEVRASEENQTVSAKKDSLKVSVDQLKAAISEVPEHDTTKGVLEKANELLGVAQVVLENTTVSLNEVEQMNKLVKRMFISVKNATTRLSSGSHDPRNGQRMAEGAGFRADGVRVEGALNNVKEYISEDKFSGGATSNGQRTRTIDKTFMTAKYSVEQGHKFITYDVYFQNDGYALNGNTKNAFWFYPPRDLLPNVGRNYPIGVVSDAYYERYQKKAGATGTLSENPSNFTQVGGRYTVSLRAGKGEDDSSERLWGNAGGLFQFGGGPTSNDQRQQMLKQLQHNRDLNGIIKSNNNPDGSYPTLSYSHLLTVGSHQNFAYKYHVKMRLRDDVTDTQAQRAGTMAVTAKSGFATNALQAYVYAATGTRLESKPDAQLNPIQGLTVTKTVGDTLGDPDDPANSGYVRHKESKPFPAGMKWSWQNGGKPASTATTAGVFKYKVIARYQDGTSSEDKGSGSDGTVTLNVKPKTPVIDQNSVNEKAGKKGQKVVVNVQNGVPDNSTVTLYSGNKVIGTGTTSGQKATINVPGVLPSTEIKAKTTVKDTTVDSEFSAPVIPTPERDTQPPTVKMTNPTNNREFVLGSSENNSPEVEVFRGATLDIPLKMHDNNANGKINIKHISGLPKGVNLNNGNTLTTNSGSETKPATATISGRVATDAHLGTNVVTLKASDDATGNVDKGNQSTLKFKVKTYDLAFEDRGTPVNDNTRSDVLGLKQRSADPNHYLTTTDGTNKGDGYFGADMKFRYLNGNEISEHVSFDKIGKYDVKARAYFPNSKTSTKGLPTNPTTGLTGDTASVAGRGFLEKTIEFNVKPNTPTLAQEQFYGTAGSRPSVTVGNLPTSDQLQNGSNVTVELYQGTTKVASKTVTDRNSTTTLFAGDFTANLREGQPVHAVVKVSGGQNATAYSVTSDNSADRNVTGRSVFAQPANKIVQIKKGNLSEEEKTAIKNAIFEANKTGILRGKTVNDITITDAGVIRAVDKDNKVAELEVNPTTGVVTRYAHIRDDYNLTFKNNGILANRPTDKGFEWSQDGKSLIYKFDATKGTPLPINDILNTITANPKNPDASGQPSLTVVNGTDKVAGERTENGYKHEGGFFYHNNKPVNVLDIVRDNFAGGGTVDNSANKLVETNRSDVNDRNIVGTNLEKGTTTIPGSNGAGTVTINTPVVKAKDGSSLIVKRKLYLMPKWTDAALLAERNTTLENNTNVINLYFVPVDPIKPEVARSNSNNLATSSNQATRLAENTSFTSLVKVTDNYDKDDATNATTNTVRSKLNMWVKTGNTKTLIVENGVEKTDVITRLKKEVTPATYEVFAKTTDASGNKSHEDTSDGASLGFFKVGYNLVARQTINVVRGETLTQAELNKLVQVREGNTLQDLPQGATVTAALETASIRSGKEETKTVEATVNFGENRTQKVTLTYKVLNTFPIARKLYDFKNPDTARSGGSSVYYHNGGTIPDGMTWIYKASDNVAQPGDKFTEALAKDPVGTTNYKFGGKYDYSRNTNRPTTTGNLEYTETVVHEVFDVEANRTRVTVSKGATLTEQNAKDAVTKVTGSDNLPDGTTYEWVNAQGNKQTPTANTPGVQNYRVKVTLPMSQTGANQPDATQKRPSKIIDVKVNVKPDVPTYNTTIKANGNIKVPTVASTDRELTGTGAPGAKIKVTVPGVTINEVTVGDNGKWRVSLPKGLNSNQLNQKQLVPQDQVTITQSVGGVESDPVNVAVSLGETTIQPSEERGNSLFAGTKNIVVKAPHDAGMVYVSYTDKATGKAHEIGLKRENINSQWVSNKPTLGEVKNTTKDAFTNTITIEMKESIAEGTAKAIANISEGKYSSAVDWKTIQVTNQAPTITSAVSGNEKIVEFGENIDLETLVTKADYEDDKDATRGTKVRTEIVSVNGQNNVKDINSRKPGTYIVKYKAIDSQGKESGEIQLTVKVREDKPTPPTATAPSDGTVTVTPTGDADKVIVNYTDEKNAQKTVTVVKAKNGTWSSSDKPAGVTVDPRTGALLIPEDGVRDRSQVTATATKGDSRPSDPKIVTAQQRDFVPVVPDKTPVTKVTNLTPEEREKVKAKVQNRNPGKNISISEDGTATLTDPKTNISHQISGDKLVESNDKIKPTVEIPYDNPARQELYVYSGETNNITIKVKDNSGKISKSYLVFAANDRRGLGAEDNSYLGGGSSNGLYLTATKIHSDTPTSENQPATITVSGNLNNQPFTGEKSITRYVFAEDPSGNTNYDHVGRTDDTGALGRVKFVWKSQTSKYDAQAPGTPVLLDNADATQIENAVKQANPTFSDKIKSVTVNGNNVIVTYKDDSTDRLDASKVFKVRDSKPTPPTATAPSDGTVTVTPTGDADKVTVNYTDEKEQNKTVTVVKDKNGTWSSSDKPAGVTVDSSTGQLLIPAEGVKDKSQVTATATKGDSHPSEPTTVTVQAKDFTPVKPDEKVVVQDKSHLTPEEKKQVEDKVKAKNPGKTVTVGEDGTATVTDPSTKISHPIAGKDLVIEDFTPVKPDEKVVVQDKSHLTPEEKKQVEDKVKAKNPGKTVTVGEDGTATVTDPSTKISHPIAGKDLVNEGFTPVKPDEKVVVQDKSHLTPEEKKQVEDKVKAKNPGKTVTVGDDGTATVTDPSTKISHPIAGKDLVNEGFTPVKPDEKVVVQDKSHLTPEEKKQVEDKVKAKNPGKTVTVGDDGTATVTDPSTKISHPIAGKDLVIEDFTPVKPDEKVVVQDKSHLTPEEKKQVEDKVKAKNPGKTVTVGDDGTATVTDPSTKISHPIAGKDLVIEDFTPVKPDEKVVVQDKSHLTPEEKKQVEDKVKAKNPGKTVTVGDDGTATVTDPSTKISHPIAGKDLVNQDFTPVKPDEKVVVQDKSHLTPEEKKQVEDKVKAKNPGKTVTVGDDGTATVTDPSTKISHPIAGKDLVIEDFTPVKPDEKVVVQDKSHLTPEEKKQVEDKVKAKNPGKTVTVGDDGTATVTDPSTKISHPIAGKDLVNEDFTPVKPDEKVVVQDKSHLTPEEKKQVEDKVKAKNPGKTVTVGDDGTATVTDPSTKISHPIAGKDLVNEGFTPVKPDEKVVVQDKSHLTPEEKKQVEDKVKAKNPGKTVTVGDDGTATVTDPSTKISHPIAGKDLVIEDFTPVKPDEKVVVQDKSHLTPEEKKQVEDKVKAKNPGKTVTVGDDGTATVTDPSTKISHPIAGKDLVNQDFTPVKPDEKVVVQDKSHLTPEEKKQVEDKVKAKNPGKTVTVGDDGTATVTDPSTKISHPIAGKDLVNEDFTPVKPDEKVVVQDKSHLTPEEKKQVEDKVKAKNPGKTVTVGDDGTATVTDPSTKISHPIAGKDLVNEGFTPVKPDEKVVVQDKSHLTPEEKKQVEDKVKAKNPGKTVTVGDDGTATVTDPSTKISHPIAGKDLVIEDFTPVKPDEKVVVQDKSHLTPEEKKQVEDKVKAKNPGKTVTVGDDGTATVTDPSTKISHPIAGKDLVNEGFGVIGVNGIPEVTPSQPEYTDPVGTSSTDGNGNLIDPPTVELPEFNGGVNGELPDPVELPKVKLIITKWIDEQGNELKPADAKAPAVLGEANEAFEHGEIEGYVFVRTDVNEEGDVVTHVFRKVTPTKPEGNGEQQGGDNTPQPTPEVPTDNTERKPETEKPTVPDTKQVEQSTQTVDAQVAPSQNQAVLPNTGTKADRATGALGALSLLGAFGLLFAKKKKDDEEETRNN